MNDGWLFLGVAGGAVLLLIGLVALGLLWPSGGDPPPETIAAPSVVAPLPPICIRRDVELAPEAEAEQYRDRPASPYLAAHAAVGEALGYVTIECWVGAEYDGDVLYGSYYDQRVANGWFTSVEDTLDGERHVQRFYPPTEGDTDEGEYETVFAVSWHADQPGTVVPCVVHEVGRAPRVSLGLTAGWNSNSSTPTASVR